MARIDTVESRNKLQPRTELYWVALIRLHARLSQADPSSTGNWIARHRGADTRKCDKRSLGDFDDKATTQRYDEAKQTAKAWFSHLGKGGSYEVLTVSNACIRYVKHGRANRGDVPVDHLEMRFKRWIPNLSASRSRWGSRLTCLWLRLKPESVSVACVMAGFHPAHVRESFLAPQSVAKRLRGRWSMGAARGEAIPLQPDLMRFTADAMAGLAFGAEVNTLESDAEVIQEHWTKFTPRCSAA